MDKNAATLSLAGGKLLLTLVFQFLPASGGAAFYSVTDLSVMSGLSRPAVYQALDELVTRGFLSVDDRERGSKYVTLYDLSQAQAPAPSPAVLSPVTPAPAPAKKISKQERIAQVCRQADEAGDVAQKFEALQEVWEYVYPSDKYNGMYRLRKQNAQELLAITEGSCIAVFDTLLSVRESGREVTYPLAYSLSVLKQEMKKAKQQQQEQTSNEDTTDEAGLLSGWRNIMQQGVASYGSGEFAEGVGSSVR